MLFRDLLKYSQSFYISRILNKDEALLIAKRILDVVSDGSFRTNSIHYLWSNVAPQKCLAKCKIKKCDHNTYAKFLKNLLNNSEYYVIIDDFILEDVDYPACILLPADDLIAILSNFYWDLEELYIFDQTNACFISINHIFEVRLYGDSAIEECRRLCDFINVYNFDA